MSIPLEIQALVERLNLELNQIEQDAIEGLNLIRQMLSSFPKNIILTQYFAAFSSMLVFVKTYRERVESTINHLSTVNMNTEEIQEVGEELATLLGRVLKAKINVNKLKNRLDI